MSHIIQRTINSCLNGEIAFCKFISANEAGTTGSHQVGFYIPHNSYSLIFDSPGIKGENKHRYVNIKWQDDFEKESRFIYYGKGSRNEYRITRFGRGFPYLNDENVGNLFILVKREEDYYEAFVLDNEEDMETFFSYFGLSPSETNRIIKTSTYRQSTLDMEKISNRLFDDYINLLDDDFPSTIQISGAARSIYEKIGGQQVDIFEKPDRKLLEWLSTEYDLFKAIENNRYADYINKPVYSVDNLVEISNTILNRRKSRAGRSLENHLVEIFSLHNLPFTYQPKTEGNKKPDFIFPGEIYYFQDRYRDNLVFLAAKRTCKDRWRQIIYEANRIEQKHLFTLQQGISKNQLDEMFEYDVKLVVPEEYHSYYPPSHRDEILTLRDFISFAENKCDVGQDV